MSQILTNEELLQKIINMKKVHLDLLQEILKADGDRLFHMDYLVIGAMQRSISLINGFRLLVENNNPLSAIPLVRLELDTAMRLYAPWHVDKPHDLAFAILSKKNLGKIKSRDI